MRVVNLDTLVGLVAVQDNKQLGIISHAYMESDRIIGVIGEEYELDVTDSNIILNVNDGNLPNKFLKINF